MTTKKIDVNGVVFRCPIEWTVKDATEEIRSRYGLQNGGIEQDDVPVLGTVPISSLTGSLVFVGGSSAGATGTVSSAVVDFASAEGKKMLDILRASIKDIVHEEVREGIRQFRGSRALVNDTAKEDSK